MQLTETLSPAVRNINDAKDSDDGEVDEIAAKQGYDNSGNKKFLMQNP